MKTLINGFVTTTLFVCSIGLSQRALAGPRVIKLEAGDRTLSTCALFEDGRIKCWGINGSGQLGLGDKEDRGDNDGEMGDVLPFVALGTNNKTTAVSVGTDHACARFANRRLKCWGANADGQLGLGDTESRGDGDGEMGDALPFVDLGTGTKVRAVSAGDAHTCALLEDGRVKCWGSNSSGQLGLGDKENRGDAADEMGEKLPAVELGTGRKATAVSAGLSHTCALLDNAEVKCWGENNLGQLGLGDTSDRGDEPNEMGDALPAVDLGKAEKVSAVSTGTRSTCAVTARGAVKCWGKSWTTGNYAEDHRGTKSEDMGDHLATVLAAPGTSVRTVRQGLWHACATLNNGASDCWGMNVDGAHGWCANYSCGQDGAGWQEHSDVSRLGGRWALKPTSRIDLGLGGAVVDFALGGFAADDARLAYSCALGTDNAVRCWGGNALGTLGRGKGAARMEYAMGLALPETCLIDADCKRREAARQGAIAAKERAEEAAAEVRRQREAREERQREVAERAAERLRPRESSSGARCTGQLSYAHAAGNFMFNCDTSEGRSCVLGRLGGGGNFTEWEVNSVMSACCCRVMN